MQQNSLVDFKMANIGFFFASFLIPSYLKNEKVRDYYELFVNTLRSFLLLAIRVWRAFRQTNNVKGQIMRTIWKPWKYHWKHPQATDMKECFMKTRRLILQTFTLILVQYCGDVLEGDDFAAALLISSEYIMTSIHGSCIWLCERLFIQY